MAFRNNLPKTPSLFQNPKISEKSSPSLSGGVISSLSDACGGGGTRYKTSTAKEKTPFPLATIICAITVTALFMFIVLSFVKVSDLSAEVSSMKKQISSLTAEEENLSGQAEYRYSKIKIEEKASSLGYDSDKYTNVYFEQNAGTGEDIPAEQQASLFSAVGDFFEKIGDALHRLTDFFR